MGGAPLPTRLAAGEVEVRPTEGLALVAGRALTLSVREFGLLVALVRHAGGIVRREDLYQEVWDRELRAGDRTIDVYVHKLRSKLEAALPSTRFIHTHVGFGYRFDPERVGHAGVGGTSVSQDVHTAVTAEQHPAGDGLRASSASETKQKEMHP